MNKPFSFFRSKNQGYSTDFYHFFIAQNLVMVYHYKMIEVFLKDSGG